jgi:hypothetical protein
MALSASQKAVAARMGLFLNHPSEVLKEHPKITLIILGKGEGRTDLVRLSLKTRC